MGMIFTRTRTLWMAIGVGSLLLIGGWLLLREPDQDRPSSRSDMAMPEMQTEQTQPPNLAADAGSSQAYAMVTPFKQQLIGVTTAVVEKRRLETTVRAVGRVDYDEQRIAHVNLRISGWVEDLFVDYTGQLVRKGQPLFTVYSPDLVATQDEYLLALKSRDKVKESPLPEVREQAEQMVEAARERLRLWTLSDRQIDELAQRGKPQTYVTIFSPIAGYVTDKKVFKGMFVQPEMRLYTIADLSKIWVNAEIYEYEVPFVKVGQLGTLSFSSYPGETFHGRVSYIYPYLNEQTRTVKVRLELPNSGLRLKPEMYGDVLFTINRGNQVAIPEAALLDSGTRKLVFLVRGEGLFEPRVVKVGPKIGSYYEVQEGITPGDRVVTSGNFLIDSESKLMAATNMMGALGMGGIKMEQAQMGEMDMGGMKMGAPAAGAKSESDQEKKVDGLFITLATDPATPRIGENRVRVQVSGLSEKELSSITVKLTYTMPMPGMVPATIP
ncbi:MAG: efflux RND transporter periplasmic adaptor subunit, partial [Nitrospiraceae bacterium]